VPKFGGFLRGDVNHDRPQRSACSLTFASSAASSTGIAPSRNMVLLLIHRAFMRVAIVDDFGARKAI
jgi:hypothetical protein